MQQYVGMTLNSLRNLAKYFTFFIMRLSNMVTYRTLFHLDSVATNFTQIILHPTLKKYLKKSPVSLICDRLQPLLTQEIDKKFSTYYFSCFCKRWWIHNFELTKLLLLCIQFSPTNNYFIMNCFHLTLCWWKMTSLFTRGVKFLITNFFFNCRFF